jgi:hypothetical protein
MSITIRELIAKLEAFALRHDQNDCVKLSDSSDFTLVWRSGSNSQKPYLEIKKLS